MITSEVSSGLKSMPNFLFFQFYKMEKTSIVSGKKILIIFSNPNSLPSRISLSSPRNIS